MSDNGNPGDNQNNVANNQNANTGYSADYVKSLRDEAAGWRTKFREAESKSEAIIKTRVMDSINNVLKTRGINANPEWISQMDADDIDSAIDMFITKYPQFKPNESNTDSNTDNNNNINVKPMGTKKENTNTNNRGGRPTDVNTVRKDPVARAKLRDQYRTMLLNSRR